MFVTNSEFYYFDVLCAIDENALINCVIHDSEESMHQFVCQKTGLEIDEVQGNNIGVRMDSEGTIESCDSRGWWSEEINVNKNHSIALWLSYYTQ